MCIRFAGVRSLEYCDLKLTSQHSACVVYPGSYPTLSFPGEQISVQKAQAGWEKTLQGKGSFQRLCFLFLLPHRSPRALRSLGMFQSHLLTSLSPGRVALWEWVRLGLPATGLWKPDRNRGTGEAWVVDSSQLLQVPSLLSTVSTACFLSDFCSAYAPCLVPPSPEG